MALTNNQKDAIADRIRADVREYLDDLNSFYVKRAPLGPKDIKTKIYLDKDNRMLTITLIDRTEGGSAI